MTEQPPQYPPPPPEGYGYQPPPPPPGYGYPPPAPNPYGGYPQTTGTNGLAIASLVCSLFAWVCFGIGPILGLIFGLVALNQIKKTGQEGRGLALAGVIISGIFLAGGVIYFIVAIIVAATSSHDTAAAMLTSIDPQAFSRAAVG